MNKSRLYNIFLLSCVILILTGCRGGGSSGSSGGSFGGSGFSSGVSDIGGSGSAGSSTSPIVNPEPSSLLLLTSGLIGMAIYAKTRLKSKNKNRP